MNASPASLGAVRRGAARRLAEAGIATPALDARIIIASVLGMEPNALALAEDRMLDAAETAAIAALLTRRAAGEPVARLTGSREFWGLSFRLTADTLVPRPDSETVVEAALAFIDRTGGRDRPLRLIDIGTGSGALLVALASELPRATGLGIDLSPGAAGAARDNAARLGLGARLAFAVGCFADCAAAADIVLSNPPYIESGDIAGLATEVREHDPRLALDGGADGLDAYRAIVPQLGRVMADGAQAFLEIGAAQAAAVTGLAAAAGFATSLHRDLAGHDRVVAIGRRAALSP